MPQSPRAILKRIAFNIKSLTFLGKSLGQFVGAASVWVKSWRRDVQEHCSKSQDKVGMGWDNTELCKGTVSEFCWPTSQHSSDQQWSLLTPCWPLQDRIISVQMSRGKGALFVHAKVTEIRLCKHWCVPGMICQVGWAVLPCSPLLPSPKQEGCPGLQLSRWYLQSHCCKKCPLCCSASPSWWHQLQSALY